MTSPLEREILTHYWSSAVPFNGGSENWSKVTAATIRRFIGLGLLIEKTEHGSSRLTANYAALEPYMEALAAVPLPVQVWVVPEK